MNFLSTAEIAKKWNISSRRVAKLAEQGRIKGAVSVGNNWLIPEYVEKPADARKKKPAFEEQPTSCNKYKFPHIIYTIHSEEQVESEFDSEEKLLLSGIYKYEDVKLEEAIELLKQLLHDTERTYIKLGALYFLLFAYIESRQFEKAFQALTDFRLMIAEQEEHTAELNILNMDLNSYFDGYESIIDVLHVTPDVSFSASVLPYLLVMNAYIDVARLSTGNNRININAHELACRSLEENGFFYAAIQLHFFLSFMYSYFGKEALSSTHILQGVDIAIEHNTYSTLCYQLSYYTDLPDLLNGRYSQKSIDKLSSTAANNQKAHIDFLTFLGKKNLFSRLDNEDYKYISYAIRGVTTEKIAECEKKTIYAVRTKYNKLFRIFKVSSKKELASKMSMATMNIE